MIFRLVDFFSPAKIRIVGNLCFPGSPGFRFCERTTFATGEDFPGIFDFENNEMIIWKETPGILPEIRTPIHDSCWILMNLRNKEMQKFMDYLRNSPAVQVTLEVHRTGIVIFNRELQKQDYVLLNSFY